MSSGSRILYVENDSRFLDIAREVVQRHSSAPKLEIVRDGESALTALESDTFDCVVSASQLPEQNGVELVETLRSQFPSLPIILFPADGSEELASAAIEAGVTDYVPKCTEHGQFEQLLNRVGAALDEEVTACLDGPYGKARLFDVLFEQSPDLINFHDESGMLVAVNDQACELTGYDRETLLGMPVWEIDKAIDPPEARESWRTMDIGGTMRLEREYTRKDGSTVPVSVQVVKFRFGSENLFFVVARDITEQKNRERELSRYTTTLEQLQEKTQTLLEATAADEAAAIALEGIDDVLNYDVAGMWLVDEDGDRLTPIEVTNAGSELIEQPPTYTRSEPSLSWGVFEEGGTRVIDDVSRHPECYNPETPIESELIVSLGGFGILNIGSTTPGAFDDEDAMIVELWADTVTTVFDRIEREAELHERESELVRERDRLDEFASFLSHDLRNPLNVAQLRLDLARQERDSENLENVAGALDRINQLVDDALTLAREGDQIEETERIGLETVAKAGWENVNTKTATISIGDLGPVNADRNRLVRVFENLFRNAVEHGGAGVSVRVGPIEDGFFVADDGAGIADEYVDRIFESGYSTGSEGTGFGLAIVRRLVEAHGWSIRVVESKDGGARFEITGVDRFE